MRRSFCARMGNYGFQIVNMRSPSERGADTVASRHDVGLDHLPTGPAGGCRSGSDGDRILTKPTFALLECADRAQEVDLAERGPVDVCEV